MLMPNSIAMATVYEAEITVKLVPIEPNKLKMTPTLSSRSTEGDEIKVTIRRQLGSQTANANTTNAIGTAITTYRTLEKICCKTFSIMMSIVPEEPNLQVV